MKSKVILLLLLFVFYISTLLLLLGAHLLSMVTGVVWVNDSVFASCGHDNVIRVWERSN